MRLRVAQIVLALALAFGGSACLATLAIAGTNASGGISAMNGFSLWEQPAAAWGSQLSEQERNGVSVVRSDAAWAQIQPRRPTATDPRLQWSAYDAWVRALATHRLTWQPIVDYNTSWASAPLNPGAFAAFARQLAARYGAGGSFWVLHPELPYLPARIFEIWNEENVLGRYYVDPATYGALYAFARTSIHAVDPSASVDIGGLSDPGPDNGVLPSPSRYVFLLFGAHPQLKGHVDAFALHPYTPSAAESIESVQDFRQALVGDGEPPSVPIDLTEFGWPYRPGQERWRAAQMHALGLAFSHSDCGIREAAPYDWINPGDPRADFGLVDLTGASMTLRAAGAAWFAGYAQGSSQGSLAVCQPSTEARSAADLPQRSLLGVHPAGLELLSAKVLAPAQPRERCRCGKAPALPSPSGP